MAAAVLDAHASAYGQVYSFKLTAVEISMSSQGHQGGRVTDVYFAHCHHVLQKRPRSWDLGSPKTAEKPLTKTENQ